MPLVCGARSCLGSRRFTTRYCSAVTAQIPDSLDVDSRSLSIQGVRGEGLFDPEALGWETHGTSSDNWRGYVARYAVAGERLVLRQLSIDFALSFLEMREPIWALELRSPVGPSRRRPIYRQSIRLGAGDDVDVRLPASAGEHSIAFYGDMEDPSTGRFAVSSGRERVGLRSGEEFHVGDFTLVPTVCRGFAALTTAPLPRLGPYEGRWSGGSYPGASYSSMDLPIPFTGGLLVCQGFIREHYVHMGFHPAWKFEHVEELLFDDGHLTSHEDVSEALAAVRAKLATQRERPAPGAGLAEITAWVRRCFRLDY